MSRLRLPGVFTGDELCVDIQSTCNAVASLRNTHTHTHAQILTQTVHCAVIVLIWPALPPTHRVSSFYFTSR